MLPVATERAACVKKKTKDPAYMQLYILSEVLLNDHYNAACSKEGAKKRTTSTADSTVVSGVHQLAVTLLTRRSIQCTACRFGVVEFFVEFSTVEREICGGSRANSTGCCPIIDHRQHSRQARGSNKSSCVSCSFDHRRP